MRMKSKNNDLAFKLEAIKMMESGICVFSILQYMGIY